MRAPRYWWLAVLVVIVLGGVIFAGRALTPPPVVRNSPGWGANATVPAAARLETRLTLDPALFVGKARLTHQIAREIPDTLDQLYCYCACDRHLGHKSLLSCYTDGHAAT